MDHTPTSAAERIGDQTPVAAAPIPLSTHDRRPALAPQLLQALEAGGELGRLHVLGVAAEGLDSPWASFGGPGRPAPAAQLVAERLVRDAGGLQRLAERAYVELRIAPGAGKPPHIRENLHVVPAQEVDEAVGRMRRVADREQPVIRRHAGIVAARAVPRLNTH